MPCRSAYRQDLLSFERPVVLLAPLLLVASCTSSDRPQAPMARTDGGPCPGSAGGIQHPEPERIAFSSKSKDIYSVEMDGSGLQRLTRSPALEFDPAWSPDGEHIAYRHEQDGDSEIYLMNRDGSNARNLTQNPATDWSPEWSPDGRFIAFASDRAGFADIWIMERDGGNPVQVTTDPAIDEYPTWSPDGCRLAFNSDRTGAEEIWIVDLESSAGRRLTDGGGSLPAWSPVGDAVVFQQETSVAIIDAVEGQARSSPQASSQPGLLTVSGS